MTLADRIEQLAQARKVAVARLSKAQQMLSRALQAVAAAQQQLDIAIGAVAAARTRLSDAQRQMRGEPQAEQLRIWEGESQAHLDRSIEREAEARAALDEAEAALKLGQRDVTACEARCDAFLAQQKQLLLRQKERHDEAAMEEMQESRQRPAATGAPQKFAGALR
ncbi:MAG: hypothetical protein HC843_03510 [Sphingomonadales bacterium]|nr:hypothetical protein [Sphingomonadales bacterium]